MPAIFAASIEIVTPEKEAQASAETQTVEATRTKRAGFSFLNGALQVRIKVMQRGDIKEINSIIFNDFYRICQRLLSRRRRQPLLEEVQVCQAVHRDHMDRRAHKNTVTVTLMSTVNMTLIKWVYFFTLITLHFDAKILSKSTSFQTRKFSDFKFSSKFLL